MARFLSQLVTVIRGSIGGITFTASPPHALVARARVAPVQPNTTDQAIIRSCFTGAIGRWAALTQPDRDVWKVYADTVQYSGPLGPYTLTGRQIMIAGVSLALWYLNKGVGVTAVDAAPPIGVGAIQLENLAVDAPGAVGTGFNISGTVASTGSICVGIEASRPFNPTRQRFKGPFNPATLAGALVAGPGSFSVDLLGLVADLRYFIRVRAVEDVDGHRISNDFIVSGIAATTVI